MRLATRRQFLKGIAAAAGASGLAAAQRAWEHGRPAVVPCLRKGDVGAQEPEPDHYGYLPVVCNRANLPSVVHVHGPSATSWDFNTGYYGDYMDQGAVNAMMERGLLALTDKPSVREAWALLLPAYQAGQKIAVKVNLNNSGGCDDSDNAIDALIQPVNALIGSLVAAGIREDDVWVYDALRPMPTRFYDRRLFTRARYFDRGGCADEQATFNQEHASLLVTFSHPAMKMQRWLTAVVPCLRKGGDGLFAARSVGATPVRWSRFGNQAPNSLLFSRDRVAIDCVMCDLLNAEWGIADAGYDYLRLAEERGLGVFERGDPFGSGYRSIEYVTVQL